MNNQSIKSFRKKFLNNILERINFLSNNPILEKEEDFKKYSKFTEKREKLFINIYLKLNETSPSLYRYRGGVEVNKIRTTVDYKIYQHEHNIINSFEDIEDFNLMKDSYMKGESTVPSHTIEEEKEEENHLVRKEVYELEEDPYRNTPYTDNGWLIIHAEQESLPTGKIREERKDEIEEPYIFLAHPKDLNDPFEESYKQVDDFLEEFFFEEIFQEPREKSKDTCFLTASFTESDNNPLMWGHYAQSGKGIIIEYNSSELLPEYQQNVIFFPIYYTDEYIQEFKYIKEKIRDPLKKLSSHFNSKLNNDYLLNKKYIWFLNDPIWNLLTDIKLLFQTVKTQKWSYEKEWKALRSSNSFTFNSHENIIYLNKKALLSVGYIREKNTIQDDIKELVMNTYKKENQFSRDWYHLSNSSLSPNKFESVGKGVDYFDKCETITLIKERNIAYWKEDQKETSEKRTPFFDVYSHCFFSPIEKDLTEEDFFFKDILWEETGEVKKILPVDFFRDNLRVQLSPEEEPLTLFENKMYHLGDYNQELYIIETPLLDIFKDQSDHYLLWDITLSLKEEDKKGLLEGKKEILDFKSSSYLKIQKEKFYLKEENYETYLLSKNSQEETPLFSLKLDSLYLKKEKNITFFSDIISPDKSEQFNLIDFSYREILLKKEEKKESLKTLIPFFQDREGLYIFFSSIENPIIIPHSQRKWIMSNYIPFKEKIESEEIAFLLNNKDKYLFLEKSKKSYQNKNTKIVEDDTNYFIINHQGMFRETKEGQREKIYQENLLSLTKSFGSLENFREGYLLRQEKENSFTQYFQKENFLLTYLQQQEEKFSLLDLVFQEIEVEEKGIKTKKRVIPIYSISWRKKVYAFFSSTSTRTPLFEEFLSFNNGLFVLRKNIINLETKEFFNNPEKFLLLDLENERRKSSWNRHYWEKEYKENFTFQEIFEKNQLKSKSSYFLIKDNILYETRKGKELPFLKSNEFFFYILREKEKRVQNFLKENSFYSLFFHIIDPIEKKGSRYQGFFNLKSSHSPIECNSFNNEVYTEFKGKLIKILNIFNEKEKTLEAKEFFKEYPFPLLQVNYQSNRTIKLKEYIYYPEEGDLYKVNKTLSIKEGLLEED